MLGTIQWSEKERQTRQRRCPGPVALLTKQAVQKRPHTGKAKAKEVDKIIAIPEQTRLVEDQDEDFFEGDEVGDFSFLNTIDAKELGKRVEKEKKQPRKEKPTPDKSSLSFDESEDDNLSEILSEALDDNSHKARDWNKEQEYEKNPRSGDSQWRKKESTRLPIRTANGNLVQVNESESELESSSESESSDTSSEDEPAMEPIARESVKAERDAVIEAKEALAKLAEEIVETPEEKVILSLMYLNQGL